MAINVQSLPNYVEEHNLPILRDAVLGSKTAKQFNLMTGVKGATALNLLNTAVSFGDGSECGWSEAGTSTLSQRVLTPGYVKINQSFCEKALLKTWANYEVRIAAGLKTLPFEEDFVNGVKEHVSAALEKALWQGNASTGNTDANTNKFDGFIKIAEDASIAATVTYGDSSTKMGICKDLALSVPYEAYEKGEVVAYCGYDFYDAYVQELIANGNIIVNGLNGIDAIGEPESLLIPGTRVRVIPVNGLNGTGKAFASYRDNFIYGTDLQGDEEKVEFWYSQDHREFRLAIEFNAGVQVAFPSLLVEAKHS